jgi:hypothetical protein
MTTCIVKYYVQYANKFVTYFVANIIILWVGLKISFTDQYQATPSKIIKKLFLIGEYNISLHQNQV